MNRPALFEHTVQEADIWLNELHEEIGLRDKGQLLAAMRAVLTQLRDRLTVEEAAHLGAQLPTLLRGVYYEQWRPAGAPKKLHSREEFFDGIRKRAFGHDEIDPEQAARGVFRVLSRHVSQGEIDEVIHMLPHDLQTLWSGGEVPRA